MTCKYIENHNPGVFMLNNHYKKIMTDVMSLPTAPFSEDEVRRYIFSFCRNRVNVKTREDKDGNILVHYKHPGSKVRRPVCFCAHTDHPGFRSVKMINDNTVLAKWFGGVPPEYFNKAKVKFYNSEKWVHGQIFKVNVINPKMQYPQKKVDTVEIVLRKAKGVTVKPSSLGMWDLLATQIKGKRVNSTCCDDLAGVSAMLCCLDSIVRSKARTETYLLFTRAEEVGFIGALAACENKTIPKKCLVISIETSSVMPGVIMGGGPILRVGDKSSVYTPELTAWCKAVADELVTGDKKFAYQRKLMDGGSCEATAFCNNGYDATGICLPLGNYHNCNRDSKKIAPEYINLDDQGNMIKWFIELAKCNKPVEKTDKIMTKKLNQLKKQYKRLLKSTA